MAAATLPGPFMVVWGLCLVAENRSLRMEGGFSSPQEFKNQVFTWNIMQLKTCRKFQLIISILAPHRRIDMTLAAHSILFPAWLSCQIRLNHPN
jgi:hypothetical protein